MTIRVGFLGTGFIARTHSYFLKHTTVDRRITAVHDTDPGRAQAFADRVGAEVAVSEDDVLDRVDAVFVTTWTSEHERLVAAAAARGVAVFCEKPLAFDAVAARRMADAVDTAGVVNQVGLVLRFVPQFLFARRLLADPRAGRVMAVSFRDDQFIPIQSYYGSTWRVDPARCGRGTLLEHSIHDVDVLTWLCGPITGASGVVRELHGYPGIDDVAMARLDFDNGAVASLTSIWHDIVDRPSQRLIEVFCENLHVVMDGSPEGPITWQFAGEPVESLQGEALARVCLEPGGPEEPALRAEDIVVLPGGAIFNPVTSFLRALRDGTPSPLPLSVAVPAHAAVDAVYASAATDGAVLAPCTP
mgnify:CR=1 FL=1